MAAFLLYLKNYKKTMGIGKMFRETILYKMGRGKLFFPYYFPIPSAIIQTRETHPCLIDTKE